VCILQSRINTIAAAYKAAEHTQQSLSNQLQALRSEGRRRLDECSDDATKLRQSLLHAQTEFHRYGTIVHILDYFHRSHV
jgi:hypothetical protein